MTKQVDEFWNEIKKLSYMSAVIGYKDNKIAELLNKYNVKEWCTYCGEKPC